MCTWLAAARSEGRRGPRPRGGGRPALGGTDPQLLAALVAEQNDATLAHYAVRLAERTGTAPVSAATLCRALARLGLRRKKDAARERARAR